MVSSLCKQKGSRGIVLTELNTTYSSVRTVSRLSFRLPSCGSGCWHLACAPCCRSMPIQLVSWRGASHLTLLRACAALMRKGKGEDVTEQDMASVVHAHNCECLLPFSIHIFQVLLLIKTSALEAVL